VSEPLLRLAGVHTYYGHIHALKGVDLEVRPGEIVTLIGANGAGKSTTLRTVSGLVRARHGEVWFDGRRIDGLPAHRVSALGIGHVPEGRRIFPQLTVEENLEVGAYLERDARAIRSRRDRVFSLFPRLADRRAQDGGTLSGGEQQMLAIGRALMREPKLVLLDEPTLGLAPVLVEQIFEIVRGLHASGMTILLVEQNAWQALQIAGRAYVLQTGSIILQGPARELAENPEVKKSYLGG
jgi:branched-chain amino acid transport system ATP-binding protein